jgi:glycosyltransferase involved in cell wall biosynthesis
MLLTRQSADGGPLPQAERELVSVITPVFNGSTTSRTPSIRASPDLRQLQILIVDDGSTDATGTIADSYAARDPRVRVFHTPNQGISGARNTALRHTRGSLIALLDGDDKWMPSYLEAQVRTLATNPWADVATANAINLGSDLNGTPYWPASNEVRPITLLDMIVKEDSIQIMSVFRRSVVDRIGGSTAPIERDYQFWQGGGRRSRLSPITRRGRTARRRVSSVSSVNPDARGHHPRAARARAALFDRLAERSALGAQVGRFSRLLIEGGRRRAHGEPERAVDYLRQFGNQIVAACCRLALAVATVWPAHGCLPVASDA